jgi:hypothetical protein
MSQIVRTRVVRVPKHEQEVHLLSNPLDTFQPVNDSLPDTPIERTSLLDDDYQAPLTANSLRPNSRWLIVRQNLHRIRFMGFKDTGKERLPDFYLGLQMTRELRRAQQEIKNIDKEASFHMIKRFELSLDRDRRKKFDISHVKPDDALIYDRLGEEPLALQNLLYYFSKQDVQQGTVFWDFLSEVNQVLNLQRKRSVLVQRLQRLALTFAIIIYSCIGLMLFSMIISATTTITHMNDPEVLWAEQSMDMYSVDLRLRR